MAHGKSCRHLRHAQKWLNHAEESLENQREMRAELDMMLAQAELQHAREVVIGKKLVSRTLLSNGLAAVVAALLVMAVAGGYYVWGNENKTAVKVSHEVADGSVVPNAVPITAASVQISTTAESEIGIGDTEKEKKASQELPAATLEPPDPAPVKTEQAEAAYGASVQPTEKAHSAAEEKPMRESEEQLLSADEMKNLVHVAGKSLRGASNNR